jgi:acetyl-CoA carboxylase biotin carboxylase subunit
MPPYYDSLAAKVLTHASTRLEAIRKMRRCLEELALEGFPTTAELCYQLMYHAAFVRGGCATDCLDTYLPELLDFSKRAAESEEAT